MLDLECNIDTLESNSFNGGNMKVSKMALLIGVLLITSSLFAGGFALTGVGSRATSMAGAFRGLADDGSAVYWNPAGLGFIETNSFDLGGTFILPGSSWKNTGTLTTTGECIPGYEHKEYEAKSILRSFPSGSIVYAQKPKLKLALGVFVPYGLGATWDAYQLPSELVTPLGNVPLSYADGFPKEELMSSLAIVDIHPTAAYQFNEQVSGGAGMSIYYSTIQLKTIDFNPGLGAGYQYAPITTDLNGGGIGFGMNFGLLFKANDVLSLGFSGKTPAKIELEGDAKVLLWKPDTSRLGGKSDIKADLNLPGDIGLGLSYKADENWVINMDYALTFWKAMKTIKVNFEEPVPQLGIVEKELDFLWENTHRVSLGTEYRSGANAYRCGIFWDQSPIPDETFSPTFPDINDKLSFNGGFGHDFGQWTLDLNMQYVAFSEREIKSQSFVDNNKNGVYNANSLSGNIGLTYKF